MATTTLLSSFAIPALIAGVVAVSATNAEAQDYTSGTMGGTVADASGKPVAGAKVVVKSNSQGITRETKTDAKGAFSFPLIPIGAYSVTVSAPGYNTTTDDNVTVVLGSDSNFAIALQASEQVVIVKGKAKPKLDFTATTTGTVVDVETLTKNSPIARNITALTLLAPSAVPGDSGFGAGATAQGQSQASLSGASVGENVFYVNGLNITNFVNGIGAALVPFDFYKTVEVKTGGYQAEYGRSTGGVINAVTKSGSNNFNFALHGNFEPEKMYGKSPNTVNGNVAGSVGDRVSRDYSDYVIEASGPIIKDKLFFFAVYQAPNYKATTATSMGTTYQETRYNDPVWGVKLDGYLTSKHHFELTAFDTTQQRESTQYDYHPPVNVYTGVDPFAPTPTKPGTCNPVDTICDYKVTAEQNFGGLSWVGRYTGNLTNWLTVSGAYGDSKFEQSNYNNYQSQPLVRDQRVGSAVIISKQPSSAFNVPSVAERKFYRADADMYFNLLGKHHVRIGLDHEDTIFNNISARNGGAAPNGGQDWLYKKTSPTANNTLGLAKGQEYVSLRTFNGGGSFKGMNDAQYIQDNWDINSHLALNVGYRNDDFVEQDSAGQNFSVLKGNKAWRLGFNFDPTGDKKDRFFGFYGRYYLPVAANTAYRAASNNLDVTQNFLPAGGGLTFGALDPITGKPTAGLGPILIKGVNSSIGALGACKQLYIDRGIIPVPVGQLSCQVGSLGVAPPPESISALNVKATAEDEYIFGWERRVNSLWKVGISATYRKLLTAADDQAIDAAVNAYCVAQHIAGCSAIWSGTSQYLISNPGEDVLAVLYAPLPGQTDVKTLSLKASDIGNPKPQRTYKALEFTFTRAFDGKWGLQGSYTWSESKGNFEGAVKSDTGQADAGITSDFDLLSFSDGAYGPLPNDHTHQIKMWGSYAVNENFLLGFNYSGISGRAYGCLGPVPKSRDPDQISTFYNPPPGHYCKTDGVTDPAVLVPRGTAFKTGFVHRLDVSARYTVPSQYLTTLNGSNLVVRADIFNLFDLHGVTEANETGNTSSGASNLQKDHGTYKGPVSYQTPRYVRLGFDLTF